MRLITSNANISMTSEIGFKKAKVEVEINVKDPLLSALAVELLQRLAIEWHRRLSKKLQEGDEIHFHCSWETDLNKMDSETLLANAQIALDLMNAGIFLPTSKEKKYDKGRKKLPMV